MIIRSQDKKSITTDLNLRVFNSIETEEYKIISDAVGFIGTYSTKEKAIKVLDMIQKKYSEYIMVASDDNICAAPDTPKVFEMPQDSEV